MALRPGLATGLPLSGELRLSSADEKMCELPMWHLKYGVHFPHCQTESPFRGNRYLPHELACALRLRTQGRTRRSKNHPVHFALAAEKQRFSINWGEDREPTGRSRRRRP